MKRARLSHDGQPRWGTLVDGDAAVRLDDGALVGVDDAAWLPPAEPGATVFALGLNYADHSAELGFTPPATPLVFLKGHTALAGHGTPTPRPADANRMHPECELVAVIGRTARRVARADALDHVAGYTVANDYAIREYLENYYRPNLPVKNRAATTPLGPWIVDAADVPDPRTLRLSTAVNGVTVQDGTTADMVFDVAALIEYLSGFMTLRPGDLILTGTPHGVHFVAPGDTVACEIEGVGRLVNTLVAA
ncbi:fumarylacetoacetate hydrolase family protein [Sphingomonas bacterium]|uniref:fumarylacetoacetate hydrolase family protein n=1 Tax=Sphingomonas bacterium TaxID=1895847 RepID=UPI001575C7B5|nr:fumarylacetoacetate hydrolase family protein [Sphingomonas bacterium]